MTEKEKILLQREAWASGYARGYGDASGVSVFGAQAILDASVAVYPFPEEQPIRQIAPSGWEYQVGVDGYQIAVQQVMPDGTRLEWIHTAQSDAVPPSDRSLVSRLLGEDVND